GDPDGHRERPRQRTKHLVALCQRPRIFPGAPGPGVCAAAWQAAVAHVHSAAARLSQEAHRPNSHAADGVARGGRRPAGGSVRGPFAIIGFDPRGVARSTPLQCFHDFGAELETYAGLPPFPMTHLQALAIDHANARLVAGCARRMPRLARHMTTGDVARDLN